jgi:type IV secretory pathway VirB2 component (pilin)
LGNALAITPVNPADKVKTALCNVYNNVLNNSGMVFAIVLIIVAWAGYMIYMGKREATDVIIKAVIATAIILGAVQAGRWILGNNNATC